MAKARGTGSKRRPRKSSPKSSPNGAARRPAAVNATKKGAKKARRSNDASNAVSASQDQDKGINTGLLGGKRLVDLLMNDDLDFDPLDPELTVEDAFGELVGGNLADAIVETYIWGHGDGASIDIPWYDEESEESEQQRTLVRCEYSRELQEPTVDEYMGRVEREGLSQRVSGPACSSSSLM